MIISMLATLEEIELFVHVKQLESTSCSVATLFGQAIIDITFVLGRATHDVEVYLLVI